MIDIIKIFLTAQITSTKKSVKKHEDNVISKLSQVPRAWLATINDVVLTDPKPVANNDVVLTDLSQWALGRTIDIISQSGSNNSFWASVHSYRDKQHRNRTSVHLD